MEGFNQNNAWRLRLARCFQKALGCAELSPIYLESVKLESLFKEFEEGVTSVCVIGTVKAGKTSLINALLGSDVLPSDDIPCTSNVRQVIRYGENRKAFLHFQSPFPMDYCETLPNDITDYLKWYNYGRSPYGNDIQIPKLEYSFTDSLYFIKIPTPPDSVLFSEDALRNWEYQYNRSQSAFYRIEFYYPSDFLKKRIIISDTRGLTDAPLMNKKTIELVQKADIVLYISDSLYLVTQDEKYFIENRLQSCGVKISGLIFNRIDLHRRKKKIINYLRINVREYVSDDAVFFVSSQEALEATKENNYELLQQSGIPKVKEFIEKLAVSKERKRFIASSNALKNVISNDMLPSITKEITKTFGENRSDKMGNLIFISTELKAVVAGLNKLIEEIEYQASNETK